MSETQKTLDRSRALKQKIRENLNNIRKSKEEHNLRVKQTKQSVSQSIIPQTIDYKPNINLDNLASQDETSQNINKMDVMTEIRQNLDDLKNQQISRESLKQNDNSFNIDGDSTQKNPFSNDDIIDSKPSSQNPINTDSEDFTSQNNINDDDTLVDKVASSTGKDAGEAAGDAAGDLLEDTASAVAGAGGEADPIQDIIAGGIAIGGAIFSGLDIDKDKVDKPAVPFIEPQQGLQSAEV